MEKQHVRLVFKALAIVIGWILVYGYFIEPDGRVDNFLTKISTAASSQLLHLLGYKTTYQAVGSGNQILYLGDFGMLGVGHPCNGLVLYAIFLGFIFIFPSSWKSKIKVSLFGVSLIFFLNVFRIAGLCLISLFAPSFFDFSHKYAFTTLLYGVIFLLWMYWINNILPKKQMA